MKRLTASIVASGIIAIAVTVTAGPLVIVARNPPYMAGAASQDSDELPDGEGKRILLASCTACHDLKEVTKFRGYYTKDEWRDIVRTMIEYGADVKEKDADVLVDYLAKVLGKPTAGAR